MILGDAEEKKMRTWETSGKNESLHSIAERTRSTAGTLERWARSGGIPLKKDNGDLYVDTSSLICYLEGKERDVISVSSAMSSTRRAQRRVLEALRLQQEAAPEAEYVSVVYAIDTLARGLDVYHQDAFRIILKNPQAMIEKNGIPYVKKEDLEAMMGK
jgi:hypothetical protein